MPSAHSQLDDRAQLEHMAREFTEGFNTGDVDRIMRFYGNTYVEQPGAIMGRAARLLRAGYRTRWLPCERAS
jgi:hypothetical protein